MKRLRLATVTVLIALSTADIASVLAQSPPSQTELKRQVERRFDVLPLRKRGCAPSKGRRPRLSINRAVRWDDRHRRRAGNWRRASQPTRSGCRSRSFAFRTLMIRPAVRSLEALGRSACAAGPARAARCASSTRASHASIRPRETPTKPRRGRPGQVRWKRHRGRRRARQRRCRCHRRLSHRGWGGER